MIGIFSLTTLHIIAKGLHGTTSTSEEFPLVCKSDTFWRVSASFFLNTGTCLKDSIYKSCTAILNKIRLLCNTIKCFFYWLLLCSSRYFLCCQIKNLIWRRFAMLHTGWLLYYSITIPRGINLLLLYLCHLWQ